MKIGEQIEKICEGLPSLFEIRIIVGPGGVAHAELYQQDTQVEYPTSDESLEQQLADAVEFARSS